MDVVLGGVHCDWAVLVIMIYTATISLLLPLLCLFTVMISL